MFSFITDADGETQLIKTILSSFPLHNEIASSVQLGQVNGNLEGRKMVNIDWVEVPAGEFIFGISDEQRNAIHEHLRQDARLDQFLSNDRAFVEWYWQATLAGTLNKDRQKHLADTRRLRDIGNDTLMNLILAAANVRHIPARKIIDLPTFYISRFPLTHEIADVFFVSAYAKQYRLKKEQVGRERAERPNMPELVTNWEIASAMAHWCGGRLPTLAEWEKAARGVDGRLYPWGDKWRADAGNFGYPYRPDHSQKKSLWLTEVDAYPEGVSPYGVWDMLGNVEEWTESRKPSAEQERSKEYGWAKGVSGKGGDPDWFWALSVREHPGSWEIGVRPILTEWQRKYWSGAKL